MFRVQNSSVPSGRPKLGTGTAKNIWMAKQKEKLQVKIFLDCQNENLMALMPWY